MGEYSVEKENKELKQKISGLNERNKMLEDLIDMLPQIVVETDLAGNLRYANKKVFELTGYTEEDIRSGLNAVQLVIPEERPLVIRNMQRILNGEKLQGNEYTALRKDGTTFSVLVYTSYKVKDDRAVGMRSIIVDFTEHKKEKIIKEALIEKLQKALNEIKTLQGIIPICAHCKNIRDDNGYWSQVEKYVSDHTQAEFSHGICPECAKQLYPEYFRDK